MDESKTGLAIIFHSGAYDRIYHGLSIALAALALGRKVKCFFTYGALEYLRRDCPPPVNKGDNAREGYIPLLEENIKRGHLETFPDLLAETKTLGAKFYTCTNSMSLLNIARNELIDAVDKSMGLTTFLAEASEYQMLFI